MLKLQPLEPEWLGRIASLDPDDPRPYLLAGVRVRFAPIGRKAVRAARMAVRDALGEDADDLINAGDALSCELIRRGIVEWEGVGDLDGEVIPVSPASIELFLADIGRFEAADDAYVRPWAKRDMEGNASAGSPIGTGAAATPANAIVPITRAPRKNAADASRTRKPAAAAAPTSSTSPRPKKAKRSGR